MKLYKMLCFTLLASLERHGEIVFLQEACVQLAMFILNI